MDRVQRRDFLISVGRFLLHRSPPRHSKQPACRESVSFFREVPALARRTLARRSCARGCRNWGYVEGRTAVIEWRRWEGKPERLREAVAEMVRLNLDVIVVGGSEATKALKDATRSIPIVFVGPSYPVEEGLVESFARPGGNITGITWRSPIMCRRCFSCCGCRPGTRRCRRHLEPG
jgi:putative ABC transport system substrate-binding protein